MDPVIYLVALVSMLVSELKACPEDCVCVKSTVRCSFLQLEEIPKDIPEDTTILDLRFNSLPILREDSFRGLTNLSTILLNNNKIVDVQDGVFSNLKELHLLYIYKNAIKTVGKEAFRGLNNLQQLYLHFNDISDIDSDAFKDLAVLERLSLHSNRLETLPVGLFSHLQSLQKVRLDDNPLVCDCTMLQLVQSLKVNSLLTEVSGTCASPAELKGKPLLELSLDDLQCKGPSFIEEPEDTEVGVGESALFHCEAVGDPVPEITWMHNNDVVDVSKTASGHYSMLKDGSLQISGVADTDTGMYMCVAKNLLGETKTRAAHLKTETTPVLRQLRQIQRRVLPRITVRPRDYSVVVGETVTMECQARGQPKPTLRWTKNDLRLPSNNRYTFNRNSGSLTIERVQHGDRGLYRCTATNARGSTSETGRLEVLVAPSFVEKPTEQNMVAGQSAFFTCRAEGNPKPALSWLKDGRAIGGQARYTLSSEGSTLWITQVTPEDSGVFDCVARNVAGRNVASTQLTVKNQLPPVLRSHPQDAQAFIGANVRFHCSVNAEPPPSITWFKNGAALSTSGKYEIQANEESLLIRNVVPRDEGTYECVAENVAGSVRAFATLTVFDNNFANVNPVIDNDVLVETIREARKEVDKAINSTLRELYDNSRPRTPQDLLALFRQPSAETLQLTRSAEIFERTIETLHRQISAGATYNISHKDLQYKDILTPLTPFQLAIVANLSNCATHRRVKICDNMCYHHKYRTFDGTCNNLKHTMWGASLTPLNRLAPPTYENGFNTPRGWDVDKRHNGFTLPSARLVSIELASSSKVTEDADFTHMLMQWGQFLDHDITFVPMAVSNARFSDGRHCNETCDNLSPCFPIPVPPNDPRIHRHRCLGVTRSSAMCGSGMTSVFFQQAIHREQVNQITSYIDASNVYGSQEDEAENLRDLSTQAGYLSSGLLMPSGKPLLPPNNGEPVDCQMDPNKAHFPCFQAGDHRANEQLGLLSLHTLFMREHNRLAEALRRLNPSWDGDMLYHEARKIVGAQMQHISYKHWLPKILGEKGMNMLGDYEGYDPLMDATIINSFATAAFRFGHSLISPVIHRLNSTFQPIRQGNLPLHKAFFAPFRLIEEGGTDPIMRGLIGRSSKLLLPNELLNEELTERLFKLAHEVALDLAALNIQRGRDHGLPTYNTMREYCGLQKAHRFIQFEEIKDTSVRQKLKRLYGHPDNVDLWVGALLEDTVPGAKVGPTLMCILVEQFKRTRAGDRFWYENPGVFTPSQLSEIKQVTLGRIICDNSDDIKEVQKDVFNMADYPRGFQKCNNELAIPSIDLKVWAHCCQDCSSAGSFHSITSHARGRRSVDYTYKEDKEHHFTSETLLNTNNLNEKTGQELGNKPTKKENPQEKHMMKMSHQMLDSVDVRIEGLEELIESLQQSIKGFKRQIKHLEKQVTQHGKNHFHDDKCIDHEGNIRQEGDQWKENDCKTCTCEADKSVCTAENCPTANCKNPQKIDGQCCLICP